MPYIDESKRRVLDPIIDDLRNALRGLISDDLEHNNNTEGNINYVVSTLLEQFYSRNYADINNAVGLLHCIALEYYRKKAVPYEDNKEFINGAVYKHPQE